MTSKRQVGAVHALKQLNKWSQSAVTLRLIVSTEPFSVFHTGCLRKLTEEDDIFYLEPIEGGGVFQFSASQCRSVIERTDTYTLISFCKGEIALKVMEYFRDSEGDVETAGEPATLSPSRNRS